MAVEDPWCQCGYRKSLHDAGMLPSKSCDDTKSFKVAGFKRSAFFNDLYLDSAKYGMKRSG